MCELIDPFQQLLRILLIAPSFSFVSWLRCSKIPCFWYTGSLWMRYRVLRNRPSNSKHPWDQVNIMVMVAILGRFPLLMYLLHVWDFAKKAMEPRYMMYLYRAEVMQSFMAFIRPVIFRQDVINISPYLPWWCHCYVPVLFKLCSCCIKQ